MNKNKLSRLIKIANKHDLSGNYKLTKEGAYCNLTMVDQEEEHDSEYFIRE